MSLPRIDSHSLIRPKKSYLELTTIRKRKTFRQLKEGRKSLMSRGRKSELSRDTLEKSSIWLKTGHLKEKNYLMYWYFPLLCLSTMMIKMISQGGNKLRLRGSRTVIAHWKMISASLQM